MIQLTEFKELAYRAYTGTSFSPEKRRDDLISSSEQELNTDLETIPEAEHAQYIAGYKNHLSAWLSAKSRCISTMITGGSNFPVRRAEKANQAEHNKLNDFIEWRTRAIKAIKKKAEAAKPIEQKHSEQQAIFFKQIKQHITESAATIMGIDNGTLRGTSRPLIVSNLTGFITRIANKGNNEAIIFALDYIKELNRYAEEKGGKPIITAANGIWKLAEHAEAKREEKFDQANKPTREYIISNGKILFNYEADRLQIIFDGKPERQVIDLLKKNAFKWAPSNMAWQRQLTNNAIYGAVNVVGEFRPIKQ